ncbi:MAG: putative metal-binding motif-containing protein [Myxococcota bacterium]
MRIRTAASWSVALLMALSACQCGGGPLGGEDEDAGTAGSGSSSGGESSSSSSGASGSSSSSGDSGSNGSSSSGASGSNGSSSSGASGSNGSSSSGASGSNGSSSGVSSGGSSSGVSGSGSSGSSGASGSGSGGSSGASGSGSGGASSGTLSSGGTGSSGAPTDAGVPDAYVPPVLSATRMIPSAAYRGEDTTVVIFGTLLETGATVHFEHRDEPDPVGGDFDLVGTANAEGTQLTVVLLQDLSRAEGLYDVTVTQGAETVQVPDAFRVTVSPPPTLTNVNPAFAYKGDLTDGVLSDRELTLTGTGFLDGASVEFVAFDQPGIAPFESPDTRVLSTTTAVTVFPSESSRMPLGRYFVTLLNPDGQAASWLVTITDANGTRTVRGTVEVRNIPPPRVTGIDPGRPAPGFPPPLKVYGQDFSSDATVSLIAADGTVCPVVGTTFVDVDELHATPDFAAAAPCSLGAGTFFLVRVTNGDGQYGDFASLHIYSNDSGKLGEFTASDPSQSLVYGRSRHDSAVYFDDVCGASLVVAGGRGRPAGSADPVGPVLEVERATITPFGKLSPFEVLYTAADDGTRVPNRLTTARLGAQVLSAGNWVFVVGGMDGTNTALTSTERATLLTAATAPGAGYVAEDGVGSLPEGRFHYKIAAILPDAGERFAGEGLASRPVNGRADEGGALTLVFEAFPQAVGYRVYRSPAPGAGPGSVVLIDYGALGTAVPGRPGLLQYTDTGVGAAGASPGGVSVQAQAGGTLALGFYGYRVSAVHSDGLSTVEVPAGPAAVGQADGTNLTLRVSWSPVPGAQAYRVYRTGTPSIPSTADDAARATTLIGEVTGTELIDDGSISPQTTLPVTGEAPLPRGSLSRFQVDSQSSLTSARMGFEIVRVPLGNTVDAVHYYVAGGRDGPTGTTLADLEHAVLSATGHLDWEPLAGKDMITPRAHFALLSNATARESLTCASNPVVNDVCQNPDLDGDGFRSVACQGFDCDDNNAAVNPAALEVCGDGVDNDCVGGDEVCQLPDAGVPPDAGITPDAGTPDAGPPVDCTNPAIADQDGDEFRRPECGGTDCNDQNVFINPGSFESPNPAQGQCSNGIDEDCDGTDVPCIAAFIPTGQWAYVGGDTNNEEVFLMAVAGAYGVDGNGNEQVIPEGSAHNADATRPYGEMVFVHPDGTLGDWLKVAVPSNGFNASGYGVEGLLYFNFLYVMGGNVQTGGQKMDRASVCIPASIPLATQCSDAPADAQWESDDLLHKQDSVSGSGLSSTRLFFSRERIFSTLFVLGGENGAGQPLSTYDSAPE